MWTIHCVLPDGRIEDMDGPFSDLEDATVVALTMADEAGKNLAPGARPDIIQVQVRSQDSLALAIAVFTGGLASLSDQESAPTSPEHHQ